MDNSFKIIENSQRVGIQRVLKQTGTRKSLIRDASRSAKLPGKRISKTGKRYWETRKNRSDAPLKRI